MPSHDPSRPNVLFILSDDQGFWAMGCAGNDEIHTPNLDRLAATGIRFENYFCASPVCSPARATVLTGRMPSQHGVHDWLRRGNCVADHDGNGELIEYLKGMTGYTDILAANGYTCGLSGKWHLGDSHHAQKGFTFWKAHAMGGGSYYNAPMVKNETEICEDPRYVTDAFTDNALEFLEEQHGNETPFYLSVHYTAPHSPWEREHHPAEIYSDYYDNCPFVSCPDQPAHPDLATLTRFFDSPEDRRELLSGYYAAVTAMDANIGRLLDWLEENGLRGNTLVFFVSDNGMNMGHHGICGKGNGTYPQNMFDTSVKVPALVSRPGHVPEGGVCGALLSHYDFMPTLLDYLGMDNPEAEQLPGRSYAAVLRGEPMAQRDAVVVYEEYGWVRMIRTKEWKLVCRYPDGPHELYDLVNDPDETEDLYGDPGQEERIADLATRLEMWFEKYSDPRLDGLDKDVTGRGQLGRAEDGPSSFAQAYPRKWHKDFDKGRQERAEARRAT